MYNPPARVRLANLPTPLEPSPRVGARLGPTAQGAVGGIELLWKRDDLTGAELSGNKVRKLEFLFADAAAQGADVVVTCGGAQSNHCRATAAAAARLGLGCVVLLRVPEPAHPPALAANSLLDAMAGADIRWVSVPEYRQRREVLFPRIDAELRAAGRRPYLIPEGGSNGVGTFGYVEAMRELRSQLPDPDRPTTIVYAAGSGGTGAGIELGLRLLPWPAARALGFAVCDDAATFRSDIARIIREAIQFAGLDPGLAARESEIAIDDGSIGPGYAQTTPEMLHLISDVARTDGIFLDPVYTGKAFAGLHRLAGGRSDALARRVVFMHTGGLFGLFPFAEAIASTLPPPANRAIV